MTYSIRNLIQLFNLHCSYTGKLPSDYLFKALCCYNFSIVSIVLLESKPKLYLLNHFIDLTLHTKNIPELMSFSTLYKAPNMP